VVYGIDIVLSAFQRNLEDARTCYNNRPTPNMHGNYNVVDN
jgi:hypothetical protein